MPDLSADRPLLLPEKQFTEEDLRIVSSALFDIDREIEPGTRGAYDRRATAVLEALAARSRLLPPSVERREETWGIRNRFGVDVVGSRWLAQRAAQFYDGHLVRRATTRFADGSVLTSPWVEVPDA